MKSGQILILVLLVVVVSLAVGLSVASRNITNLRTSTQTEQSQRAFTAAEGGIEQALTQLRTIADAGEQIVPVGDINASVNVVSNNEYEFVLNPGDVGQVNLEGYSGPISIEWIKKADSSEYSDVLGTQLASIELTYVCQGSSCPAQAPQTSATTASGYSQHREAYDRDGTGGLTSVTCSGVTYYCSVGRPAVSGVSMLRIKPFWRQATVKVTGAADFPVQTYEVESVASSEIGVTRRVKVTRTALEQLPAAFDYVLFSEGDIVK